MQGDATWCKLMQGDASWCKGISAASLSICCCQVWSRLSDAVNVVTDNYFRHFLALFWVVFYPVSISCVAWWQQCASVVAVWLWWGWEGVGCRFIPQSDSRLFASPSLQGAHSTTGVKMGKEEVLATFGDGWALVGYSGRWHVEEGSVCWRRPGVVPWRSVCRSPTSATAIVSRAITSHCCHRHLYISHHQTSNTIAAAAVHWPIPSADHFAVSMLLAFRLASLLTLFSLLPLLPPANRNMGSQINLYSVMNALCWAWWVMQGQWTRGGARPGHEVTGG